MPHSDDVLVLRDEDGVPFLLPKDVVFANEFISLQIGDETYLVEPGALAKARLTGGEAEAAKGLMEDNSASAQLSVGDHVGAIDGSGAERGQLVQMPDDTCVLISQEVLNRSVVPPELESVAEELMAAGQPEVEGHAGPSGRAARVDVGATPDPLCFSVGRLGEGVQHMSLGRGQITMGAAGFIS